MKPRGHSGAAKRRRRRTETSAQEPTDLMERVVERGNVEAALKRVRQNKGSPGIDGMTVDELPTYLAEHWEAIREQLLAGHLPAAAGEAAGDPEARRRGAGARHPDACSTGSSSRPSCRCCSRRFDPTFSEHSYGFRPGRRAHDAVCAAQRYIQEGRRWVVDVDLEKFFDRVNHDVLMGRLAKRIADKRVLRLIRRYLEAGIMADGVVMERHEGTPQGGPLSPLLANVLLDEVDKELEKRGHAFVRYADDCNVYVRSKRAGERCDGDAPAAVRAAPATGQRGQERGGAGVGPEVPRLQLLGGPGTARSNGAWRRKALAAMKDRVRQITSRSGGRSLDAGGRGAARLLDGLEGLLPTGRDAARLPTTSTNGSATDCERCSSSSGSGARRSTASCALGAFPSAQPRGRRAHAAAGGGRPAHGAQHRPARTATSTGSASLGLRR